MSKDTQVKAPTPRQIAAKARYDKAQAELALKAAEAVTATAEPVTIPEVIEPVTIEPEAVVSVAEVVVNVDDVLPTADITVFRNEKGKLCKEFSINAEGEITKTPLGDMYQGFIETKKLSLLDLKEFIESLSDPSTISRHSKAFGLGVRKPEFANITKLTTDAFVKISRTKDKENKAGFFEFNDQPAFMLLDYDDYKRFKLSPLEVHAKLIEIIPEFKGCGALIVPSSSAGIYKANELPPDEIKSSCHIYMIVERGSCIPDLGKFIEYRAWSNNCGYIKNDVRGGQHRHHLFDAAVFSPERLVFEAPPILKDDLKQVPRKLIYIEGGLVQC
jgi:hypothetical protein